MSFNYKSLISELVYKGIVLGSERDGFELNPYLEMPKGLEFTDIGIEQEYSEIESRLDTDISSEVFRGVRLQYPMLASNMMAVTNAEFCVELRRLGALGVLHRGFPVEEDYLNEVTNIAIHSDSPHVAVSVGAGPSQIELAAKLVDRGANIIFLDVAHGYTDAAIFTGRKIKLNHPEVKLVIGNTTNSDFLYQVEDFAAAVKVSIGTGSACETRYTASCYVPPVTVLQRFKKISKKLGLPIIQDGGISGPDDFVKSIACGAQSVMMGRNFAMCPESAARTLYFPEPGKSHLTVRDGSDLGNLPEYKTKSDTWFRIPKKEYFGMASRTGQDRWRGGVKDGTCTEGRTTLIDVGAPAKEFINRYAGALRSGMTYVGARTISEFQDKARFVRLK